MASPAAAKSLNRTGRRHVIVHADAGWFGPLSDGADGFWPKAARELAQQGIDPRMVRARARTAARLIDPGARHVHVVMGDMPGYGANLLHVEMGYVRGFWYLDEVGGFWNSSLRLAPFAPERVNRGHAEYFFKGVVGWVLL